MRGRRSLVLAAALSATAGASAQGLNPADLEGYSITIQYTEGVSYNGAPSVPYFWDDKIYISTKGRIFHTTKQQSSLRSSDYSKDTVSETVSADFSNAGKFRWTESGIVRGWFRNKFRIQYSIYIDRTRSGFTCRALIERFGYGVQTQQIRQSCRVVRGNIHT